MNANPSPYAPLISRFEALKPTVAAAVMPPTSVTQHQLQESTPDGPCLSTACNGVPFTPATAVDNHVETPYDSSSSSSSGTHQNCQPVWIPRLEAGGEQKHQAHLEPPVCSVTCACHCSASSQQHSGANEAACGTTERAAIDIGCRGTAEGGSAAAAAEQREGQEASNHGSAVAPAGDAASQPNPYRAVISFALPVSKISKERNAVGLWHRVVWQWQAKHRRPTGLPISPAHMTHISQ